MFNNYVGSGLATDSEDFDALNEEETFEEFNESEEALDEMEEVGDEEEPVMESDVLIGIVEGCSQLNVRVLPDANARIVCAINSGTELMIDQPSSNEEFYKICTSAGIEGFCMKKFISVRS